MHRPLHTGGDRGKALVRQRDAIDAMDTLVKSERRVEVPFCFSLVVLGEAHVTPPKPPAPLPNHVADTAIERQGFLVTRPRRVVVGAAERDVAEPLDAVG